MAQHFGNAEKQFRIDMTVIENLIGIGTVAMDVLGKPSNSAPLCLQFGLDYFANVKLLHYISSTMIKLQQFSEQMYTMFCNTIHVCRKIRYILIRFPNTSQSYVIDIQSRELIRKTLQNQDTPAMQNHNFTAPLSSCSAPPHPHPRNGGGIRLSPRRWASGGCRCYFMWTSICGNGMLKPSAAKAL